MLNDILAILLGAAFIGVPSWVMWKLVKAARKDRFGPTVEEEEFVNIALCETRAGIYTHYHEIGVEPLNCSRYPIKGHLTLCGAEVGWDMVDQDAEAACDVCRAELAKMARRPGEKDD